MFVAEAHLPRGVVFLVIIFARCFSPNVSGRRVSVIILDYCFCSLPGVHGQRGTASISHSSRRKAGVGQLATTKQAPLTRRQVWLVQCRMHVRIVCMLSCPGIRTGISCSLHHTAATHGYWASWSMCTVQLC